MDSKPPYSICLHPIGELISDTIRKNGRWLDCPLFPSAVEESIKSEVTRRAASHAPQETIVEILRASDPYLNGVVVDVGANIGSCAFELANMGHEVFALEAVTANVQLLEATRRLNSFKGNLHILHGVVTNSSHDHVQISASLDRNNMGGQAIMSLPDAMNRGTHEADLPAWQLDDVIHCHIDFLKMDCQGCEYNAIFGARKVFEKYGVGIMYMELAPHLLRAVTGMETAPTDLLSRLIDYGMTMWAGGSLIASHADVAQYIAAEKWAQDEMWEENLWAFKKGATLPDFLREKQR